MGVCMLKVNLDNSSSLTTQEFIRVDDAAKFLGISVGSVRNLTSNGKLLHYKLGRRVYYRLEDLRSLLLSEKRGKNGY